MAEQELFMCDSCFREYKDELDAKQKGRYKTEKCAFCGEKKQCKWSKITYGKKR